MSGSSRRISHSHRPRQAANVDIAVTEASFQSLALSPSPANQQYTTSISPFQASEQQYRRPSYGGRGDPTATYLQSPYDSGAFTATSSSGFPIIPSQASQLVSRSSRYHAPTLPSQPQTMPAPSMSTYTYMQPPLMGSATGSTYNTTADYYPQQGSSIRSMSTSFPPPPRLPSDPRSVEEREVARQRRRNSQENRRQSKMRARRTRLPSIMDAGLGSTQVTGGSVDSSLAAPSMTTYVSDPNDRSYSTSSYGSTRVGYNDVVPGTPSPYDSRPHESHYSNTVNPYHMALPMPPNTPSYPDVRRTAPIHTEPVILDRREKPRCYDHGCNGREFSTFSNLLRHQREKSGTAAKSHCPNCGAEFTRTTARNGHMEHGKCKPRRASDS